MIFSPVSIAVFAGLAFLVFGPKKLPELGQSLGKTIRNFKQGISEHSENNNESEHSPITEKSEQ